MKRNPIEAFKMNIIKDTLAANKEEWHGNGKSSDGLGANLNFVHKLPEMT